MNERTTTRPARSNAASVTPVAASDVPVTRPFEKLIERLGPHAVFGEPVRSGDTTVIPVAEVRTGFGFGGGRDADDEGSGMGGGAGVRVTPRGYIQMKGGEVRFRRLRRFSPLGIALGAALASGLIAFFAPIWRA